MAVRAVLFDFGGTLDSPGVHPIERFLTLYERADIAKGREEISAAYRHADRALFARRDIESLGFRAMMDAHIRAQLEFLGLSENPLHGFLFDHFCSQSEHWAGVSKEVLGRLRKRFRLGVVSNFHGNLQAVLAELGLRSCFEVMVDSHLVGARKPDPEIFRIALDRLALSADEAVYVGDSYEKDIEGAQGAGLRGIWLWGDQDKRRYDGGGADGKVNRLCELAALIETLP